MSSSSRSPGPELAWRLHVESPVPCILFESVRDGAGVLLDFRRTAFNPVAGALVQGLGRSLSSWREVEGLPERDALERMVDGGAPLSFELHGRLAGAERWFQARTVKLGDGFALWLFDITEVLEQARATRAREEHLRLALETARMVTWEWSDARGTLIWSPNVEAFFGLPPGEPGDTLKRLMERMLPKERTRMLKALEQGRRAEGPCTFQFRRPWADGTMRCYEVVGQTLREEGQPTRVLGVVRDCTERERAVTLMQEEAQFRERFIGVLGHDLRNPLNAISLSVRALQRYSLSPAQQQLAQRIESSATRMGNMISDILDLTRARLSGGIPLHLAPTKLSAVCRQVVDELTVAYPERHIALETEGRAEGIWDSERLAQVVSNLVGNALEHGSREEPVFVRCSSEVDRQVLEIFNPGAAIPSHLLATLFDPFRQLGTGKGKGKRGSGLGLGLFIVRELVEAHGGQVTVRSGESEGTTFTVFLPRDSRRSVRSERRLSGVARSA